MAEQKKGTTAGPVETKIKRHMLTADERIARIEAELAAAKAKREAKGKVEINKLLDLNAKDLVKQAEAGERIKIRNLRLDELGYVAEPAPDNVKQLKTS